MAAGLRLSLHGVDLTLDTEREDFIAFARRFLPFQLQAPGSVGSDRTPIRVSLSWNGSLPAVDLDRLGRWVWAGQRRVRLAAVRFLPGLQMDVVWEEDGLRVSAAYRCPSRRSRWLTQLARRERARLYVTLIYYLIYFPWAWWMELERGWSLQHAAGLVWGEDGILLAGLPGCGKSAVVWAALHRAGWRFLSDNLLFVHRRRMWACPEPIHLDRRARELGGGLPPGMSPTGMPFSHGRENFTLDAHRLAATAPVRAVVLLGRGRTSGLRRLGVGEAWRRIWVGDLLAQEWLAYRECSAALYHVIPAIGDPGRRWRNLQELADLPCYEVTLEEGGRLAGDVTDVLERLVRDDG